MVDVEARAASRERSRLAVVGLEGCGLPRRSRASRLGHANNVLICATPALDFSIETRVLKRCSHFSATRTIALKCEDMAAARPSAKQHRH